MIEKELTIIIPFINETYELEDTLKSIREYSENDVEIIVIDDASDDHFDYKSIAEKYDATYSKNTERIGVAASRDIGVNRCTTAYFLLLDAHMRFYDKLWVGRIIKELRADPKALLCSQTRPLMRVNGVLTEDVSRMTSFGACINLDDILRLFEPKWIIKTPVDPASETTPIPCVLGAGYACGKEYWQYLKGLEGLIQYGNDEAYISLKVWMSGGSCKLAKDLSIGHIYRNSHPYSRDTTCILYNKLFLGELFLRQEAKRKNLSILRLYHDKKILSEVLYKLHDNRSQIEHLKAYHETIFAKDIAYFRSINDRYLSQTRTVDDIDQLLKRMIDRVTNNLPDNIDLLHGQMGIVLFLYQYARYFDNDSYWKLSDKMLKDILKNIKSDLSYCYISGLCGIGWGIEYLHQHSFIDVDTNKMLEYIDKKIMEIDPARVEDIDKEYGFGGIVLYLLARLYTIHTKNKENPFDDLYLSSVHKRVRTIIDQRIKESNSIDVFLSFSCYFEHNEQIEKTSIYDACSLVNPKNILIPDLEIGLKGAAGVGLLLMLEENPK